ncbi:MAG: DNA polymerase [Pseudonocardia sp.]|nr:DNA polymerase [Pseudonocardia sp.]
MAGPPRPRRFARSLALALLALSVAANALGHGLAAFSIAPAWWVVVVVSAVAPAVLGAVVHLAVLVGRAGDVAGPAVPSVASRVDLDEPVPYALTAVAFDAEQLDDHGLSRFWENAGPAPAPRGVRAAALIADGAGRRRLARELGISEYEARQLIDRSRSTPDATDPADADPEVAATSTSRSTTGTSTEHDAAPQWASAVNGSGRALS